MMLPAESRLYFPCHLRTFINHRISWTIPNNDFFDPNLQTDYSQFLPVNLVHQNSWQIRHTFWTCAFQACSFHSFQHKANDHFRNNEVNFQCWRVLKGGTPSHPKKLGAAVYHSNRFIYSSDIFWLPSTFCLKNITVPTFSYSGSLHEHSVWKMLALGKPYKGFRNILYLESRFL